MSTLPLLLLCSVPTVSPPGTDGVKTLHFDAPAPAASPSSSPAPSPGFDDLDALARPDAIHPTPQQAPSGWNRGAPEDLGDAGGDPVVLPAVEDIPGNQYPRKATLYLNFLGGDLGVGADNSALNKSQLAKAGPYPAYTGGQQQALAAAQELANDLSAFGVRVVYEQRPGPIAPYTMAMIGGHWTDTNLEDAASGVAPGADCGALGQRHVVYTFAGSNWSSTEIANVTAQEAGHAWGLDHSVNCGSVMSYCGGGNKSYSSNCDPLCESECQGPAGCRLFHEQFCGVGADAQDEVAELQYLFGGPEPDLAAPVVEIVSPADGDVYPPGTDLAFRATVTDDYGGFGWKFVIARDGEIVYDAVDYERDVDQDYRPGLNLDGLESGVYDLGVVAEDQYGNQGIDMIRFTIEPAAGDDGGDDDSGGGDDGTGGTQGDAATDEGDGAGDADATADDAGDDGDLATTGDDAGAAVDDGSGCSCRSASSPSPVWTLGGLLWLWGGVRRRRAHSTPRRTGASA